MQNRWSDEEAQQYLNEFGSQWGDDLALRTYTARLLGRETDLVLHGGGNTSVKTTFRTVLGEEVEALYVKASGFDLARITPSGHCGLDLAYLKRLEVLDSLSDESMVNELRTHLFDHKAPTPSIEALAHAFLPFKFIDHTHADSILALTNQPNAVSVVRKALGEEVIVIDYVEPGFELAKVTSEAFAANPGKKSAVWIRHGLVTCGETAREAYERTISLVTKAEDFLKRIERASTPEPSAADLEVARERWAKVAPVLRGLLAEPSMNKDRPFLRKILIPLIDKETLRFVNSETNRALAMTPPLTSDHLIRTKAFPLWISELPLENSELLKESIGKAVDSYRKDYEAYLERHASTMNRSVARFDSAPEVILLPGIGAACAGKSLQDAVICRDITAHTLAVKATLGKADNYSGLEEEDLFKMEYRTLQHAKLRSDRAALDREVALVTGAAGAIGHGICEGLLRAGCHVAVSDLPGERLDRMVEEFQKEFGARVMGVALNVTDKNSVSEGFRSVSSAWGGVDILVINAGVAHVSPLSQMQLEAFQRLERVNIEGTLLVLSEAARHFETQGTGGDVVLVSTKNVFAPGATFGAYSATKAAAHQLARIASLEMAGFDVRVNMVSPDAVFGDERWKSGLWQEVGPGRMRARGLDEKQLQEYYQQRNLLKAKVTAEHVSNATLFFVTRQTPTSGATLPVDGGLPDSTPR